DNGVAAANVFLELRFFNGSGWSTRDSQLTAADGSYLFSPPALLPGQKYYVSYINNSNPNRLFRWGTRQVATYQPGAGVLIGNFDIANIVLLSPPAGTTGDLPFKFEWIRRPATSSDSYEFNLTDPNTGDPFF